MGCWLPAVPRRGSSACRNLQPAANSSPVCLHTSAGDSAKISSLVVTGKLSRWLSGEVQPQAKVVTSVLLLTDWLSVLALLINRLILFSAASALLGLGWGRGSNPFSSALRHSQRERGSDSSRKQMAQVAREPLRMLLSPGRCSCQKQSRSSSTCFPPICQVMLNISQEKQLIPIGNESGNILFQAAAALPPTEEEVTAALTCETGPAFWGSSAESRCPAGRQAGKQLLSGH